VATSVRQVELEEETSGETVKYQIVGEDEADLKRA
jgi:transcription elongation GreA/GreB family factor